MLKNLSFALVTAAVGVAHAASYNVTLFQDSMLNGKALKAGAYKIAVQNNSAILKHDKDTVEAAAHTETVPVKFASTMVRFDKNNEIREICIGGSKTKVVMDHPSNTAGGAQ